MNKQKIQSITRTLGIICLVLVVVAQLFKSQKFISPNHLPYLALLSLILLSTSLILKAKAGGFSQYHLPIKMILIFIIVVVAGIFLIYQFTT